MTELLLKISATCGWLCVPAVYVAFLLDETRFKKTHSLALHTFALIFFAWVFLWFLAKAIGVWQ